MNQRNPKRLKIFLTVFILLTVGLTVAVFVVYRRVREDPQKLLTVAMSSGAAGQLLGKVSHPATRDGVKEWSLEAESAQILEEENRVVLSKLAVVFFTKEGEVYLTARKGVLKSDTKDIEVTGSVVVKNEGYRLETETLQYERRRHILLTQVPVEITGKSSRLAADSMAFDLRTNKTFFKGNVEGVFSESFAM